VHRILAVAIALFAHTSAQAGDASLPLLIEQLGSPETAAQMAAARELADSGDERAIPALEAMVAGQLYVRRSDGAVVIARREGRGYELFDPLYGEPLGSAGRRDVSRIALQGAERDAVRRMLVALELGAGDVDARRAALDAMLDEPGAIPLDVVRRRLDVEQDRGARRRLEALLLLATLDTGSTEVRIDAAGALAGFSYPSVRARLQALADNAGAPPALADAATAALRTLDRRQGINERLQTVFFGLSLGSVLVLAAIGLAITFGVMGVINMAHGELIMLGAYTAWGVQALLPDAIGLALILAIPAAFVVSGAVGILIERTVIRHLYQRPAETLLATFGVSLILQQAVRSLFGPLNRTVVAPGWMSGSFEITDGLALTYNRAFIILFCLLVFAGLLSLIRYSRFGLELRAVAQNRRIARILGVRSGRIDALTFGLGSGVAGMAGVALSQLTNVGPNLGQAYIVDSFLVVVVGGVGNLWGTLVAGLSIGIGNKLLEPVTGAVLAKIVLLVAIILFIQKKPRGLFPQRGRVADA
jgi:urea transport system permease protein